MVMFLHVIFVFVCFACQWMSQVSSIFHRVYTAFKRENPLKSCTLCIVCFLKAILNLLIAFFFWHFSPVESKLCEDALEKTTFMNDFPLSFINGVFFQVCHFLGRIKYQIEQQHTLVFRKTLQKAHKFCSLIPRRKWLTRLRCIEISW